MSIKNERKLRDYKFLKDNSEKHVYKLPFPKIFLPKIKKKIPSASEKLDPLNWIINQDDHLKLLDFEKSESPSHKLFSNLFPINHTNKEKKRIKFATPKNDDLLNFSSEFNCASQGVGLIGSNTKVSSHIPRFVNRNYFMKNSQSINSKDLYFNPNKFNLIKKNN